MSKKQKSKRGKALATVRKLSNPREMYKALGLPEFESEFVDGEQFLNELKRMKEEESKSNKKTAA